MNQQLQSRVFDQFWRRERRAAPELFVGFSLSDHQAPSGRGFLWGLTSGTLYRLKQQKFTRKRIARAGQRAVKVYSFRSRAAHCNFVGVQTFHLATVVSGEPILDFL